MFIGILLILIFAALGFSKMEEWDGQEVALHKRYYRRRKTLSSQLLPWIGATIGAVCGLMVWLMLNLILLEIGVEIL